MLRPFFIVPIFVLLLSGCKEGCTDYFASNYDNTARRDDGTCVYFGCTDEDALNFRPSAKEDDGSCEYPGDVFFYNHLEIPAAKIIEVYWEDQYIGSFSYTSQYGINYCEQTTEAIDVLGLDPGNYNYEVILKQAGTNDPGETIRTGVVVVESSTCHPVLLDE